MRAVSTTEAVSEQAVEKHAMRVRDYFQILAATVLVALFLKTCVVEAYRIPSASMENTLRVGDFLLANKFIYGAQTPSRFPFTSISLPRFRLPAFAAPQRGDIVVFELPENARGMNPEERTNYVKRCIALPGDTLAIRNGTMLVNGKALASPEYGKPSKRRIFPNGYGDARIFPKGSSFNEDNYGPLAIPKRGETVALSPATYFIYKDIIEHEGNHVRLDSNSVFIGGERKDTYTMAQDYYFMVGDNRDNSLDSRFWGFVPDDLIVGKVMMIYFSVDEFDGSFPSNVRWGRIGTVVH